MKVEDGILTLSHFSVGWNFHHTRQVKSFGLALSFAADAVIVLIGPLTFVWLM